jgi:hypothetical protein
MCFFVVIAAGALLVRRARRADLARRAVDFENAVGTVVHQTSYGPLVRSFILTHGRRPESVSEALAGQNESVFHRQDEWGKDMTLHLEAEGWTVTSNGRDQLPETVDDIATTFDEKGFVKRISISPSYGTRNTLDCLVHRP